MRIKKANDPMSVGANDIRLSKNKRADLSRSKEGFYGKDYL